MPKARARNPVVEQARRACADERTAVEFWERYRWSENPACVHCGGVDVYKMMQRGTAERDARFRWRCRDCAKQYTVRVGTVMEGSNIAFRHWTFALWLYTSSKKGFAAKQLERMTGLSYKSALFLAHRIRYAMADEPTTPLSGVVEVDESYVGGKPRPLSKQARERYASEGKEAPKNKRGRGTEKTPVLALVERGGRVVASPLASVNAFNLKSAIRRYCSPAAAIMTDEANLYTGIGAHFGGGHHTTNTGSASTPGARKTARSRTPTRPSASSRCWSGA
jgi:transposase-like protein